MSLTNEQVEALLEPLHPGRVRQVQGNSHLEAWDIRRHLLRVFGWGGFDIETLECACILERSFWSEKPTEPFKGRHTVAYRMRLRLIIKDPGGNEVTHFDGAAIGDAQNQPSLADAHDMALKTADSQALKRCAINLGDRYGLSLYNKGQTGAVVSKTLGNVHKTVHEAIEDVHGGEMDESTVAEEEPQPASTGATSPEGEEAPASVAEDPPAPAAPSDSLEELQATIKALQEALPKGKQRVLRAWAAAQGMTIAADGLVDVGELDEARANTVLEHLAELQGAAA